MSGTTPPRNIIYFSSDANPISLAGIGTLPYTDVIVGFLVPDANLNLYGAGGAFNSNLQSNIQTLQKTGKNVLISVGGGAGFPSSAYQSYAQNVNGLVSQIVNFVTSYGFNGVDIDYEDSSGFTGSYDGVGFLTTLTSALAQALPSGQNIVTHAPQTPYWDSTWNNAPYAQIWQQAGNQIAWINNQFYNNAPWDATPDLKVQWYRKVAAITGAQKLMVGALVADTGHDEGYIPLDQMVNNVIAPLKATFGSQFGGVMGWEFALDQGGAWANGIGHALNNSTLDATFSVYPQAVIRSSYLGTGIHFAPFEKTLTTDQWNTVLTRVGFMVPSFARVMISADFYSSGLDGSGNPVYRWDSSAMQQTYRMLDYCQVNAIAVVFGEWSPPDAKSPSLFPNIGVTSTVWTKMIGDCLDYLRNTKGYTCIRYYNFVNEPNGSWSGVGNYPDWQTGLNNLYNELSGRGFLSWLEITGPDTTGADDWVGTAAANLSSRLGAYDIHRYDSAADVESGALASQMTALRYAINTIDGSGQTKTFTMNETGIIDGKIAPDSQPNVKAHKYGVWIADMVVQDVLGGMDGQINWDLDDAQHTGGGYGSDNLKEWGFWNSYGGQDGYDPADADPRPWFYTWSLLAKFLPQGGQTQSVANDRSVSGVRVAALKKANGGSWDFTFVVVNDSDTARAINIVVPGAGACTMKQYNYQSGDAPNYPVDANKLPVPAGTYAFNLGSGFTVTPQARSVYVFTTFGTGAPSAVGPETVPIGKAIWLKAGVNGNYVSAWLGGVNPLQARSSAVGTWEKFNVVDAGGGFVALQAQANGLYVSAWVSDSNTPLEARASSVNTWEKFQWCDLGNGSVALRAAADGLFVSAWSDVNTPLQARSTNANGWEIFQWGTP